MEHQEFPWLENLIGAVHLLEGGKPAPGDLHHKDIEQLMNRGISLSSHSVQ